MCWVYPSLPGPSGWWWFSCRPCLKQIIVYWLLQVIGRTQVMCMARMTNKLVDDRTSKVVLGPLILSCSGTGRSACFWIVTDSLFSLLATSVVISVLSASCSTAHPCPGWKGKFSVQHGCSFGEWSPCWSFHSSLFLSFLCLPLLWQQKNTATSTHHRLTVLTY